MLGGDRVEIKRRAKVAGKSLHFNTSSPDRFRLWKGFYMNSVIAGNRM